MNLHNALDGETEFTSESMLEVFRSSGETPNFMGATYNCDGSGDPTGVSICTADVQILEINDGATSPVGDIFDPFAS